MKKFTDTAADRALRAVARVIVLGGAVWTLGLVPAVAQERTVVGFTGVYEFGLDPAATFNSSFGDWCGCNGQGEMLGHTVWFSLSAANSSLLGERFGLASSLRFGTGTTVFVGRLGAGEIAGDTLKEYQEDAHANLLQFDLTATTKIDDQLRFGIGPWFSFPVSFSGQRFWRQLRVGGVTEEGPEVPLSTVSSSESYRLAYGALVRTMVDVPLSPHTSLHPEVYARIDIGRLNAGETLGAFMVGGGTSFLFDPVVLFSPPAPPVQPPTAPPLPPAPVAPAPPTASIAIYALDRDGERSERAMIRQRRERHLRQMPLPTTFRFVAMSEEFAEPYRLDHGSPAADISIDSLAWLGSDEVALQGINIIGSRLRASQKARIRLVAVTVGDEPIALGVARAARIRRYLHERWGIEEKRMPIRTIVSKNPAITVPTVMIACSDGSLSSPVEAEWIEERFDAPRISLRPEMLAPAGVRRWRVEVSCGDRIVSTCSSDSTEGTTPTISFDLRGVDPGARMAPLVARLVVEDSSGATVTATDDLGVALDPRADTAAMGEQIRYILPSSTVMNVAARNGSIRSLARFVRNGARIVLSSYGPAGADGYPSREEILMFAEQIRRNAGRSDVSITVEDAPSTKPRHPGYDIEVVVDNGEGGSSGEM